MEREEWSQVVTGVMAVAVPLCIFVLWLAAVLKKVNPAKPVWAYSLLTLLPLWLWLCPAGLMQVFSFSLNVPVWQKTLQVALGVLYSLELILVPYLLIRLMFSPAVSFQSGFMAGTARGRMANARQQLHYSIYASLLLGILCVLPMCLLLGFLAVGTADVAMLAAGGFQNVGEVRPGTAVLLYLIFPLLGPIGWVLSLAVTVLGIMVGIIGTAALVIALALSLNGTLRALYSSREFKTKHILYIVGIFIPIVNIVAMLRLCGKTKRAA